MKSKVMILDASYEEDSIENSISSILAEFPRDWRGLNVLVKPNIIAPRDIDDGVTTHPSVVRAVVRHLKEAGASVKVGDNPGVSGYGKIMEAAKVSGIYDASEGCFVNIGQRPEFQQVQSDYFNNVPVSRDIFEADIIVNLPKMKTHSLTYITGAVKNTFGYVTGGHKMLVHSLAPTPKKFAEALLDIYQLRPPELSIMDAVVSMEGNGPANGTLRQPGKLLASDNAVALDTVFLYMIDKPVNSVPLINIAGRRGLGATDMSDIEIVGRLEKIKNYKMPTTYTPGILGVVLNRLLSKYLSCLPGIDTETCINCGICINHCPVDAMIATNGHPSVDKKKCIKCYCCQEMCPEGAVTLNGKLLNTMSRSGKV